MTANGQVYEPCLFGTIELTTAFNWHGLYTMLPTLKIMDSTHEKMTKAREIALRNAKIILAEAGISENDRYYSIRLYEMQFKIYHELKLCLDIPTE